MSREVAGLVDGFHGAVSTAVGLGVLGLMGARRDARAQDAVDEARHQATVAWVGAAHGRGQVAALEDAIARLREQLADANRDVRFLRGQVADLRRDVEVLEDLAMEAV